MTPKPLRYALVQYMRGNWIVRLKGSLMQMGREQKKRGTYATGWTVVNTTRNIGDYLYGR